MSRFAADYAQARERFLRAAQKRGATMDTHRNPGCAGPGGSPLYTDVAWIGPRDAGHVLVCVSGTHGVEGHCGSACQVEILTHPECAALPSDTATLFVHALNPYGMAHDRRVNEDNIDLNRNWIDHDAPPSNEDYELLHAALVPSSWTGPEREQADRQLLELARERGVEFVQTAITQGQWAHPDGLFYGGREHAWSTRLLSEICTEFLPGRRHVAYIDLHTGLGGRGEAEPIFRGGRDSGALDRAREWYGQVTQSEDGTSSSTPIVGNTASLVADALDAAQLLTAITLEFGTLPGLEVLTALRADNWLHLQRDPGLKLEQQIAQQIREAFCPSDEQWRAAVVAKARDAYRSALGGLAGLC